MTQTMKDKENASFRKRPGQRQQERLQRQARRQRRQLILISVLVSIALVALVWLGIWQYQRLTAEQAVAATKLSNQHATATAKVVQPTQTARANATATVAPQATATVLVQAELTATSGAPLPKSGAASPPAITGTPVTTSDGLKYVDMKVGVGATAQSGSSVQVEYTGWLAKTNKKFDSSYDHGGTPLPVTGLGSAQIITGFQEGLIGMKAGGTRRIYIPAALAYGATGSSTVIPPNADLIFDVTILTVQ